MIGRLWTRLTCNSVAVALRCRVKGHEWETLRPSRCVDVTMCVQCGQLRGWGRDFAVCGPRWTVVPPKEAS